MNPLILWAYIILILTFSIIAIGIVAAVNSWPPILGVVAALFFSYAFIKVASRAITYNQIERYLIEKKRRGRGE